MPLSTSNFEYTTTNIPAFLSKLWTLVEDPKYDELIAWDPAGFSFHVYDQTRFSREILPRFFKHNNMASFIRQLNMYGFRKVNSIDHGSLKSEKEDMEFHHPYFMRGKEQFLEFIKRKVPDLKAPNQPPTNTISNSTNQNSALQIQYPQIKSDELSKVLDDVNSMKSRQKVVDDSIFNMKKENEALWKEIASLRQKHHHQQQIVNKLIHFLVHLVNPSSLGLKRTRPLMIDSHSAAKLSNIEDSEIEFAGDGIKELEDDVIKSKTLRNKDHDDHDYIITTNPKSRNRIAIVEEEDEDDVSVANHDRTNVRSLSPAAKRLKTSSTGSDDVAMEVRTPASVDANVSDKTSTVAKEALSTMSATSAPTNNNAFLNPSIFLNTSASSTISSSLADIEQLQQAHQSQPLQQPLQQSSSPIVSTPESPESRHRDSDTVDSDLIAASSVSPNAPNSNLMNDHVESLQLDLNSIKEYLTQNTFNTVDPFTINNIFSPIVLDQIENDVTPFYIEPNSTGAVVDPSNNNNNNRGGLNAATTATADATNGGEVFQFSTTSVATNGNGKIVGNELVQQYGPIHLGDYFNLDEIFTANKDASSPQQQPQPPETEHDLNATSNSDASFNLATPSLAPSAAAAE